jgi:hypothetical protein
MTRAQFTGEHSRLRADSLHVHAAGGGCEARIHVLILIGSVKQQKRNNT